MIDANESFVRYLGFAREELIGRTTLELGIWPDPADRARLVRTVIESRWLHNHEERVCAKSGEIFDALLSIEQLELAGQRCLLVIFHDVTERKRMEEALRESNERLRALINASPLAICGLDREGKVQTWNPAAERIFGFSEADVLGKPPPTVPDDKADEHRMARDLVYAGKSLTGVELRRRRKNGSLIDISLSAAPLRDGQGQIIGVIGIMEDITEAKRLRQQLLQSHRMETVGRLAGGVAHDFNNLLAVISGYSESLLRRVADGDPLRPPVEEIQKAADRGAALTRQLLAFSRRQVVQTQPLDLAHVVSSVNQMLRRVISDKIEVVVRNDARRAIVRGDPGQMEQVLVNLALNARDAMPDGGVLSIATSDARLTAGQATAVNLKPGRYVKLEVRDTGCGMDEEVRSRIFEPFYTTKDGKGTGLGLSIVYGIVQQCGGNISVSSEPGKGTRFSILLPAVREDGA